MKDRWSLYQPGVTKGYFLGLSSRSHMQTCSCMMSVIQLSITLMQVMQRANARPHLKHTEKPLDFSPPSARPEMWTFAARTHAVRTQRVCGGYGTCVDLVDGYRHHWVRAVYTWPSFNLCGWLMWERLRCYSRILCGVRLQQKLRSLLFSARRTGLFSICKIFSQPHVFCNFFQVWYFVMSSFFLSLVCFLTRRSVLLPDSDRCESSFLIWVLCER